MSGAPFNLPPLINNIEFSSRVHRISPNCVNLDDIYLIWNKTSLDSRYNNIQSDKISSMLPQSRSFETRYNSPLASSNYFRSSSPISYNDSMLSLPIIKQPATLKTSRVSPYSPPSSPACNHAQNLPHSSNGQNSKKSRKNFSKSITKILKDWMYANISHPFPNDMQKVKLSMVTGLSIVQINNWFLNGRRRLLIIKKVNNITKYYKI